MRNKVIALRELNKIRCLKVYVKSVDETPINDRKELNT